MKNDFGYYKKEENLCEIDPSCDATGFCKADKPLKKVRESMCCERINETIVKNEKENVMNGKVEFVENKKNVKSLAKALIESRQLDGNRMGFNDDTTNTNLISKHYSPLIVRKYNIINGWPLWIGMICDEDLSDLDMVVNDVIEACEDAGMISNNIQQARNITGILSESIQLHYNSKKKNCVEGVIISLYLDKLFCQNAMGDFMNHTSCRIEYAGIMAMVPHI